MTLSDLKKRFRLLMPEAPTSVIDDTNLTALFNEGQEDIARRTECLESYTDSTVVDGTQEYSIPSTAIRIKEVYYGGSGDWEKLPMVSMDFLADQIDPEWFDKTGNTVGYFVRADKVGLFYTPTASEAGANYLRMYTVDKPTEMTTDSSNALNGVNHLTPYHELIVFYAMYHVKMLLGKIQQSELLENKYLQRCLEMKRELNRMDDFQQPIIPYYKSASGWSMKQNPLSQ